MRAIANEPKRLTKANVYRHYKLHKLWGNRGSEEVSKVKVKIKHNEETENDIIVAEIRGKETNVMQYNKEKGVLKRRASDIFWKYKGFGLPVDVIEETAKVYGGATLLITTTPNKKKSYVATLNDWKEQSERVNFGYGRQYVLPMAKQREIKN